MGSNPDPALILIVDYGFGSGSKLDRNLDPDVALRKIRVWVSTIDRHPNSDTDARIPSLKSNCNVFCNNAYNIVIMMFFVQHQFMFIRPG